MGLSSLLYFFPLFFFPVLPFSADAASTAGVALGSSADMMTIQWYNYPKAMMTIDTAANQKGGVDEKPFERLRTISRIVEQP
jgi:hypothetical protein